MSRPSFRTGAESRGPADPESLYRLVASGSWSEAVALVHASPLPDSDVARRAAALLVDHLAQPGVRAGLGAEELERLLLLGRAGRLPVARATEDLVIESLIERLRDDPARALAAARFRPDLPACAALLAQFGEPERRPDPAGGREVDVRIAELDHGTVAAGRSIFRSPGERALFEAAVEVFPNDLVCPNVALHAALDYDLLAPRLTSRERRIFFSALVDLVVFARDADFVPRLFVELDGPAHQDHRRSERDATKDRIVALSGHRLLRLRPVTDAEDRAAYARLLKALEVPR